MYMQLDNSSAIPWILQPAQPYLLLQSNPKQWLVQGSKTQVQKGCKRGK